MINTVKIILMFSILILRRCGWILEQEHRIGMKKGSCPLPILLDVDITAKERSNLTKN